MLRPELDGALLLLLPASWPPGPRSCTQGFRPLLRGTARLPGHSQPGAGGPGLRLPSVCRPQRQSQDRWREQSVPQQFLTAGHPHADLEHQVRTCSTRFPGVPAEADAATGGLHPQCRQHPHGHGHDFATQAQQTPREHQRNGPRTPPDTAGPGAPTEYEGTAVMGSQR